MSEELDCEVNFIIKTHKFGIFNFRAFYLYSALALRLNKKISTPDVVFTPGISADACGISEYEALKFIDNANLIYKLHLNFTSEFYHRQVSLLSLERCEELLNEIESIKI